jgi:alkanesulfonate monooxygenase SsuD/methylene tetrahydromethanopterin reductase-like flavin-dependent oxidoreductase (luciferase family)
MRVGIHLPHIGRKAGPDAIRRAAIQAEELGFSDAWSSEHIIVPKGAPHFTSFSIPIAICCGGVPLASASWSASSRLRPTGACRPPDPLHRGPAGAVS